MRLLFAPLAICLCPFLLQAAESTATGLPADAARLSAAYRAELGKLAQAYNAALQPMAENYVLALKNLSSRLKDAKDATGAEAVRKEAARYMRALGADPDPFESVPELTQKEVSYVETLRLLQTDYVARRTLNDQTRDEKTKELAEKYLSGLDLLQNRYADNGQAEDAAAVKKEVNRVRVALQRKDFANRAFEEAGTVCRSMPPVPDLGAVQAKAETAQSATRNLSALALTDLSPALQAFLTKPLEYDKDWPPEITKWTFEGSGNYSHDFSLYNQPGMPDELGIFAFPKTLRAYVRGTKKSGTINFNGQAITWLGKAVSWRLNDSRDLVCKVVFTTQKPAVKESGGPAACVAVYSITEKNRLIASMSVPMLTQTTSVRMAKHYSYNRMNILWEGTKRKRGFTIPDHLPMRVVVGIAGFAPGEEVDATLEVQPCGQVGDLW